MDGEHSWVRIILPALGKIYAWLWTSWAEQGQVSSHQGACPAHDQNQTSSEPGGVAIGGTHEAALPILVLKLIASVSWPVMDGEDQQEQMLELIICELLKLLQKLKAAVLHSIESI